MGDQPGLFEFPADNGRRIDEKTRRVAEFNLMAYGDYEKAIKAIEDDIGRDERMYDRAMVDYKTTLRLRGMREDSIMPDMPSLPNLAIRTKRLAIDWLRKNKPIPGDVW